jgi:hypothetical protein
MPDFDPHPSILPFPAPPNPASPPARDWAARAAQGAGGGPGAGCGQAAGRGVPEGGSPCRWDA